MKELTREEIYELGKKRPFHKFVTFPININVAVCAATNHMLSVTLHNEHRTIYTCSQCGYQVEDYYDTKENC